MSKFKHAMIFMGMGAAITFAALKVTNNCNVNDIMKKEKKMFKNIKNKFMCN